MFFEGLSCIAVDWMIKGICHSFLIPQLDKVVMINVKHENCFGSQDLPHPCGFQLLAASHDSEDLLTYCFDADLPLLALKGRDLFLGGRMVWCVLEGRGKHKSPGVFHLLQSPMGLGCLEVFRSTFSLHWFHDGFCWCLGKGWQEPDDFEQFSAKRKS